MSELYRRAFALVRGWPWLLLPVVAAEFVQHVVEIRVGMFEGAMDAHGSRIRISFGIVKIVAIFLTMIASWRLWSFDGDVRRALMPTTRMAGGVAIILLIQVGGEAVAFGIGRGLVALSGDAGRVVHLLLGMSPLIAWALASVALFPWYVALVVEDRTLTVRIAIAAARGRLVSMWGLWIAGILPLMALHYALNYAAMVGAPVWPLMIVDAAVVGLLTAAIAATYYTLFRRAAPAA